MSRVSRYVGPWIAVWLVACAGTPTVGSDQSGVWGYLRLVPREGVERPHAGAYADRRLAGVELFDYSQPGFAVVWVEAPGGRTDPLELTIRTGTEGGPGGVRIEPEIAAGRAGAVVRVRNGTDAVHGVSCPQSGVVLPIEPGGVLEIPLGEGLHDLFLLDRRDAHARVFAAPGPFSVVSQSGRFEITGVEPGTRRVRAWHPRLPPRSEQVELPAGSVARLDLELGVSVSGD